MSGDIKEFLALLLEKNGDYTPKELSQAINSGEVSPILMKDKGILVGFALVQLHSFIAKKYVHIAHVWIFPEFRKMGHHENWMLYIKKLCRDLGCAGITTSAHYEQKEEFTRRLGKFGFVPKKVEYTWEVD